MCYLSNWSFNNNIVIKYFKYYKFTNTNKKTCLYKCNMYSFKSIKAIKNSIAHRIVRPIRTTRAAYKIFCALIIIINYFWKYTILFIVLAQVQNLVEKVIRSIILV